MTISTMGKRNLAFLLSPLAGNISLSEAVIPAGTGKVEAGTVLGELTAAPGSFAPSPYAEVAGIEGAETAKAVLGYAVDATDVDVRVTIVDRLAEVKLPMLTFEASVDDETKIAAKVAQLDAVNIRAR
ncbi:head decoration protein [Yoonia sp. I 8.24]|uniref:head decoration protein n=1 Tax=Yoonia sp. I 8.24 TaxID=1537229 RepID=UPI001EDE874B|nr:head decoration protein [Yoonia sp. I 8.24]MCG3266106.1 head decoration protein [Yoonia sp. I 8.24]